MGHLYQGRNKLGEINPRRQAKSATMSYREAAPATRNGNCALVKVEPDEPSSGPHSFNKADTGYKRRLPVKTLFDGAKLMDEQSVKSVRNLAKKSCLKIGKSVSHFSTHGFKCFL